MSKYITKTGIEAIARRFRFELERAAENRDSAVSKNNRDDILYYMHEYATVKRVATHMADTLHSIDHSFKQETFLKQCGIRY